MSNRRQLGEASGEERDEGDHGLSPAGRRLLWIVAYYLVAGLAVAALWRSSPALRQLLESERTAELAGDGILSRSDARKAAFEGVGHAARTGPLTLLALLGALATALPVAWVYSLTRRRKGFEQSMVHTLILLPLAVAGMVVLVQNSLAIAFSLTGIVALLRFRNTLEDTKDGVYVFVATTIGISAAIGALSVGVVTSVLYNATVLTLWWADFAREPTPGIRGGIRRLARLPRLESPAEGASTNGRGREKSDAIDDDAEVSDPANPVFAEAAAAWRRQLRVTAEHATVAPDGRFNTRLRVHTTDPVASRLVVERVLDEQARRWELVGVVPAEEGRSTLRYVIRVGAEGRGRLLNAVREQGGPSVVGIEFR